MVATLMLGGVSCAYAQDGPSEKMRAPDGGAPSMQESDRGSDATTKRSSQGEEKSSESNRQEGSSKARATEKTESRSGQSEERGNKARSAEEKSDTKRATKSDNSSASKDDAKGATEKSANQGDKTDASKKSAADTGEQTDRKAGDATGAGEAQKAAGDKTSTDSAKRVDLTGDKRTRVQTALRSKGDIKRRTGVNITIAVGTRLPRDWEFVPVPDDVVLIVPEYRGYYFAYVDDTYVICDPESYEVVAVFPADRSYAGGNSSAGSKCSSQLSLNADERDLVLQSVSRGREVDIADLSVGRKVPRDVELLSFPDSVISEASELGSCRYFDAGDQIAIVDPDEDKIVLIIDKS
ncbi:MAG: DUF1236 domain-containing protein [Gammaproteobacteria bacterium]